MLNPTLKPPSELTFVSVNQLKNWSRCQKKFYLETVQQLHWPTDKRNFQLGQDVHKLIDYHARDLDCTGIVSNGSPEVQKAWKLLMAHPLSNHPVLGSEWGFNVPLSEIPHTWLIGRVDRIARDGDQILIIDWKTGTAVPKDPASDWQTLVYLYATYEARHDLGISIEIAPEDFQFVYVEVKNEIRTVSIPYSMEQHQKTKELLTATVSQIRKENEYPLPETCPDRFCPYRHVCGINELDASSPA